MGLRKHYEAQLATLQAELNNARFKADAAASTPRPAPPAAAPPAPPAAAPPAHFDGAQLTPPTSTNTAVPTGPGALEHAKPLSMDEVSREMSLLVDMKLREAKFHTRFHIDQQRANDAVWLTAMMQQRSVAAPPAAPLAPLPHYPTAPYTQQQPAVVAPSYFSRFAPPPSLYPPAPHWTCYPHTMM